MQLSDFVIFKIITLWLVVRYKLNIISEKERIAKVLGWFIRSHGIRDRVRFDVNFICAI